MRRLARDIVLCCVTVSCIPASIERSHARVVEQFAPASDVAGRLAEARRFYEDRRLADAEAALLEGVVSMRLERAAKAADPPPADLTQPVPVGGSVTEPIRTRDFSPIGFITSEAVRLGAAGIVTLEFVVKQDGTVDRIRVIDSVKGLDAAALAAAKRWRYRPSTVNGKPVEILSVVAIDFTWRSDPMPSDYLQAASFFYSHRHYAHAEDLLARALAAIRAEKATFGPSLENGPPKIPEGAESTGGDGGVVQAPVRTKFVNPVYPDFAVRAKVDGWVVVEAVIDSQGRSLGTRVVKSSNAVLDQAAVDAVRRWEYRPATREGAPTECIMTVTVVFKLK
jgi:TonB family protein